MKLLKRLGKSESLRRTLVAAVSLYLRLCTRTLRWRFEIAPGAEALISAGQPVIGAFWHGRLMLMPVARRFVKTQVHVLISGHRDGVLISRAVAPLGFSTISGSSRRGGAEALRKAMRLLAGGDILVMTPDGPKGPRMRAKPGVIKAAQLSGCPILPVAPSSTWGPRLNSWDRFFLPLPFASALMICGEPLSVPSGAKEAELETLRKDLEDRLIALVQEADRRCRRKPIEPGRPIEPAAAQEGKA